MEHLHPLEYHRPDETVLHIAGSTIDLRSCSTSLEFAEVDSDNFVGSDCVDDFGLTCSLAIFLLEINSLSIGPGKKCYMLFQAL